MVEEIFFELGIELRWDCGRYKNRHVRYLEREGLFQVGESDETFDRWSNSVDFEFDIWQPKGMRQFINWCLSDYDFICKTPADGEEFYNPLLQKMAVKYLNKVRLYSNLEKGIEGDPYSSNFNKAFEGMNI